MPEKRGIILIGLILILTITLPFIFAVWQNNADLKFGGFLINPIDGHSYLAKMEIGRQGSWIFNLPYTAEAGKGAYLFLFYIILGHAARIFGAENILVFHAARILGAVLLVWSLNNFFRNIFNNKKDQILALIIALFGSGLGWMAVFAGSFTSDFWVAEAYPFLSAYTNPHFTIGLALLAWMVTPGEERSWPTALIAGLTLAIVQPFAVVIVILVIAAGSIKIYFQDDKKNLGKISSLPGLAALIGFGLGGGGLLIYQYLAITGDPYLAIWNDQNLTPSPAFFDLLLSFSPCLLLAAIGGKRAWKSENGSVLIFWSLICLVLLAVPWNLQRRFITGLFLPLAGLSIFGLKELTQKQPGQLYAGFVILLVLALPTNLIVIYSAINAAVAQDPAIYLEKTKLEALEWLADHAEPGTLVAADPDFGLQIPSLTGLRVIYGHPFETVHAEAERNYLLSFFGGDHDLDYYQHEVNQRGIDWIVQEGEPGKIFVDWESAGGIAPVFSAGEYTIYQIED